MKGKDSHLTRQIDERQTHHAKLANTGKHHPGAPTCGNARGYKEPAPQQLSPRCAKKAWTTCAVTFCRAVLLPHADNRWAAPPNGLFLSLVRLTPAYAAHGSWWCRGQERGALSTLPCWLASLGFACNLENASHLHTTGNHASATCVARAESAAWLYRLLLYPDTVCAGTLPRPGSPVDSGSSQVTSPT